MQVVIPFLGWQPHITIAKDRANRKHHGKHNLVDEAQVVRPVNDVCPQVVVNTLTSWVGPNIDVGRDVESMNNSHVQNIGKHQNQDLAGGVVVPLRGCERPVPLRHEVVPCVELPLGDAEGSVFALLGVGGEHALVGKILIHVVALVCCDHGIFVAKQTANVVAGRQVRSEGQGMPCDIGPLHIGPAGKEVKDLGRHFRSSGEDLSHETDHGMAPLPAQFAVLASPLQGLHLDLMFQLAARRVVLFVGRLLDAV
mmetsp:Transcript_133083/g.332205  ORF Transcript_133083/g.332205 Transcript_133083/m.332205 type:complete len:254 (-) Transcript_133083:983-1744(-)